MTSTLKRVDPSGSPGLATRAVAALAVPRFSRFISRRISWKLDPIRLRVTRGHLATTLVIPTALLETQGARSGARRRNAIIYFHDGSDVIIAASNAGASRHPAWYYNLRANPEVLFGGMPMQAREVIDEVERRRLWKMADCVFPAYANYRHGAAKANRTIPIVRLIQPTRE